MTDEILNKIEKCVPIVDMTDEEINKLNLNVIYKAMYKTANEHNITEKKVRKPKNSEDKILIKDVDVNRKNYDKNHVVQCTICGGRYTRSNASQHRKTKLHMAYYKINRRFQKLILDD
jgi:hypothetical protein